MSFRISAHPLTTSPKALRYGNGIGILSVGHQDPTFTQHRHRDVVHTRTCPHDLACPLSCGWTWLNHFYTIYNAWTSKTQQHVGTLIPTHLSSAFRLWWIIELVDASWKIWWSPSKFHANYGGTPFGFLVLKIYMQPRNSGLNELPPGHQLQCTTALFSSSDLLLLENSLTLGLSLLHKDLQQKHTSYSRPFLRGSDHG